MTGFPVDEVRRQFPALGAATVFLDNPAGTQVPRQVMDATAAAMAGAASNLGGCFQASRDAVAIYEGAHAAMADLLGADSGREIVVGQSMSALTFQISRSLGGGWKSGDEIIVTRMDHEGNVSPWLRLAQERGLIVRWLSFNPQTWRIEPQDLQPLLRANTRLLALNYASNLTGSINPVAELSKMARDAGALVYVDAVQFAPHGKVEAAALGCDFLACSAYKFFGPHLGVLWGRESLLTCLDACAVRCAPRDLPGRHEVGTPQTELLAGLSAAVDYWAWLGGRVGATGDRRARLSAAYRAATAHEMPLARHLIDGLLQIPQLRVQGITDAACMHRRVPTVSLTHPRHTNRRLAQALAELGINVWSGHNYALEAARHLGLDESDGVLRIGLAHYNTRGEVERIVSELVRLMC
jgi:cysteine desulfurase family protein (TIGR01976 family)